MKNTKSIFVFALVLSLALAALPAPAFAAGPFGKVGADPAGFPEVFDLRNVDGVSYVTPVKLQDPFGTCWGFAAIASAETSILSSGLAEKLGYTAETLDLSEKHLAYFLYATVDDPEDPQYGEGMYYRFDGTELNPLSAQFNMGGLFFFATGLFAAGTGPVLEDSYELFEYHGKNGVKQTLTNDEGNEYDYCYGENDDWSLDDDLRWVQNFILKESYIVDPPRYGGEDEAELERWRSEINAIKDLLYSGHAVEIGFYADLSMPGQEALTDYISENWAQYTYDSPPANHGVAIVGWDDHYPRENFSHKTKGWLWLDDETCTWTEIDAPIPEHDGAWLVKNSWGSGEETFPNRGNGSWGLLQGQDKGVYNEETGRYEYNAVENALHTGYFWLSYEDCTIQMPEALDFDLVTGMEGYYLLEYDLMPVNSVLSGVQDDLVQMANVFVLGGVEGPLRLDHVSCQTGTPNTTVHYDVYLLEDGDAVPTDGTRVSGAVETYRYGGFHKAKLDTPVRLEPGQCFAVVVTQEVEENGKKGYALSIQGATSEYGAEKENRPIYAVGVINPGESRFLFEGEWYDLTDTIVQAALLKDALSPGRRINTLDNFPIKAYLAVLDSEIVSGFADVAKDAWYADAVRWAAENEVTVGTAYGLFSPDAGCSRAQVLSFLWRAAGSPEPSAAEAAFEDLDENAYYYRAVQWAAENGIAAGTASGSFSPDAPVDRAQMAAFLYRYEQAQGGGFTGAWAFPLDYADAAEVPEWAYEPFCWLTMNGVVNGSDGRLLPGGLCTRAQAVTMLHRFFAPETEEQ